MTIEELAAEILKQTQERLRTAYPASPQWEWERVRVVPGPKYTKIDRGTEHNMSGMLMIENATGEIYGIKGYGKVHKGHHYGNLATTTQWDWSDYYPSKLPQRQPVDRELFNRTAPEWNCVAYPGEGMHLLSGTGSCGWCGMSGEQITAEYVKDPANPTDAELAAAVKRGLATGQLVDAAEWMERNRPVAETEILRKDVTRYGTDPAWLVERNGQFFVISTAQMGESGPETTAFRATADGEVTSWDGVAGERGADKARVLAELTQRPADDDGYVMSARDVVERAETKAQIEADKAKDAELETAAQQIADSITAAARASGDDPIAWVTGNSYMPPLRSFSEAEAVYQADDEGEDFAHLAELVEGKLDAADVALESPEYDNALYAVDLRRFEYDEDPDGETLQGDWKPKAECCPACESEPAPLPVQVRRDGKVMAEVEDSNAAFAWLLRHQGMSTDWAIRHEGWSVTDASGTELPEYRKG